MEISFLLGTTRRVPQEKFPRKPYNKFFIDQACLVELDVDQTISFACLFLGVLSTMTCLELDMDLVSFHRYFRITAYCFATALLIKFT